MKSSTKYRKVFGVAVTTTAIAIGGVVGFAVTTANAGAPAVQMEKGDKVDFPKNGRGETYGSALEARTPADEPDLIRSVGDDGKIGYLKKADLDQGTPKSPEEAVNLQNSRNGAGRVLKLYAEDGTTVIGQRTVGKAAPHDTSK